ncbi:hypothetical protein V3C99_016094 [Haemonchus contortus]
MSRFFLAVLILLIITTVAMAMLSVDGEDLVLSISDNAPIKVRPAVGYT